MKVEKREEKEVMFTVNSVIITGIERECRNVRYHATIRLRRVLHAICRRNTRYELC